MTHFNPDKMIKNMMMNKIINKECFDFTHKMHHKQKRLKSILIQNTPQISQSKFQK